MRTEGVDAGLSPEVYAELTEFLPTSFESVLEIFGIKRAGLGIDVVLNRVKD